jgi:hypothetical protein
MAFRIETRIGLILFLAAQAAGAQSFPVRHAHWHGGGMGDLAVSNDGISFAEAKKKGHSRIWKYEEIQQIELSAAALRILTYEDQKWKLGRDREYVFDQLPEGFAQTVYAQWRERLDQRFIAGLPDESVAPAWEIPAKLLGRFEGSQGVLRIGADRIVYEAKQTEQSRTWRFADIENIASAGPFDFSIVTREHHGDWNAGAREFRFQLKRPLAEERYNELWRRLNSPRQSALLQNSLNPLLAGHWPPLTVR